MGPGRVQGCLPSSSPQAQGPVLGWKLHPGAPIPFPHGQLLVKGSGRLTWCWGGLG